MVYFSRTEIKDLTIAIIVITVLYAYLIDSSRSLDSFIILLPISLVTVGVSFIFHELGHKFVAQHYGFVAEFRKWNQGLILAVITTLLGFIFLAPGAVYIGSYNGYISNRDNGIISVAGPAVNIVLAIIFLFIGFSLQQFITPGNMNTMIYLLLICTLGFSINSFLAFFNLLPVLMLDGAKVLRWNRLIWVLTIVVSLILTIYSYRVSFI